MFIAEDPTLRDKTNLTLRQTNMTLVDMFKDKEIMEHRDFICGVEGFDVNATGAFIYQWLRTDIEKPTAKQIEEHYTNYLA